MKQKLERLHMTQFRKACVFNYMQETNHFCIELTCNESLIDSYIKGYCIFFYTIRQHSIVRNSSFIISMHKPRHILLPYSGENRNYIKTNDSFVLTRFYFFSRIRSTSLAERMQNVPKLKVYWFVRMFSAPYISWMIRTLDLKPSYTDKLLKFQL